MKNCLLAFILILFYSISCSGDSEWDDALSIKSSILKTSFPNKNYNIIDFGAVEGNVDSLCTEAINNAIINCSLNGGGIVIIPKGTWYTGALTLKSNVNLHVSEGSVLKFATDYKLYLPTVLTRWEGIDCFNFHPLIYALNETNIALTGKGIIDGQASNENWWWMNGNVDFGWKEGMNSQKQTGRSKLLAFEQGKCPIEERQFGYNDALRPQLINFYQCNKVLIEGLTIKNSPFWVIHPVLTNNIIVSNVKIESLGPNSDGCDPESCNNVLIDNCHFNTGDDCIAIKSGRNNDGRKWNIPSQNIVISNCTMAAGHGGVVIGSEISGGCSNVFVENCVMNSPDLLRVIRIKSSTCRGGLIENVFVRNIKVIQCDEAILHINLKYEPNEPCDRFFNPIVRNINLDNITSEKSKYGVQIIGLEEMASISDINVNNCDFSGVEKGIQIIGAERVKFNNSKVNGKRVEQ